MGRDVAGTVDYENERCFADGDGVGAETAVDNSQQLRDGVGTEGILIGVIARGIDMSGDMMLACLPDARQLVSKQGKQLLLRSCGDKTAAEINIGTLL